MKGFFLKVKKLSSEHSKLVWAIGLWLLSIILFFTCIDRSWGEYLIIGVMLIQALFVRELDKQTGLFNLEYSESCLVVMGICLLITIIIWMLPISCYWSLVSLGLATLPWTVCFGHPIAIVLHTAIYAGFYATMLFAGQKTCEFKSSEPEKVVIEYVDKDKHKVLIQDKGIYQIGFEVKFLNSGDTVNAVFYRDRISILEEK